MYLLKTQGSELINMDNITYISIRGRNFLQLEQDGIESLGCSHIADPSSKCELIAHFDYSTLVIGEFYSVETALGVIEELYDSNDKFEVPECEDHDYLSWERFGTFKPDIGKTVLVFRENTGNVARKAFLKNNMWCSECNDFVFSDVHDSDYWIYI